MGETLDVIYKGLANLKNGFKPVPGRLFITKEYLIHKPNDYFAEEVTIPFADITRVEGVMTKILGRDMLSNILEIETKEGHTFQFIVNRQKKWLEIMAQVLADRGEMEKLVSNK
ncbi:hypothetical protein PWEIH_08826 [Listeria weihenstephanensis FSL R9-0317]|uniref:GRAM domain-containing protein n=1 Tax=Listeria weihenstephanensis TaxID=1006155 RepID=A0A1S7FTB8_9LIST|nr:GRAM domain-containing protein [Listeria weihenstephanensis]AQY50595.1 hypothetical protein UE46_05815 [Listeria weihenstephanensis]EUJ38964.1 hypothetical protein PWEIH_08826 [Listeria weihenstephanensis FSL R9-0317]MBC1500598.1 hypothetical protein [Listeria weihenstephanensis]